MQRIVSTVRTEVPGDFLYFNGLPTAEQTQLAYRGIGISLYSSAVFCFVPEIALAFHRALGTGDDTIAHRLLARASTARSSNCAPGPRIRRLARQGGGGGCAASTSARCGRRCTNPPRTTSNSLPG